MKGVIEEIGKKYGRLTIIKRSYPNKRGAIMWLCKCDCGNEKIACGRDLRSGCLRSCGCLQKEGASERCKKGIYKLELGMSSMRALIHNYRNSAKKRKLKWELTEEQFAEITQRDCYYCGAKPNNINKFNNCNGVYIYNGIDRVDNNKGYTIDNIVPCCRQCNQAKSNYTTEEFLNWAKRLILNYKNKGE